VASFSIIFVLILDVGYVRASRSAPIPETFDYPMFGNNLKLYGIGCITG